jgi:signal transduction histidine kinase
VNCRNMSDLYEVAARATINERCATAYLHDIRGSMQALFSALELLGRSARKGGSDLERVERACALAQRAISFHEKSTLDALQILTLQDAESATVDASALMGDVVHFLRNKAANKQVSVSLPATDAQWVAAERARLQTLLVGLLADAIDATPVGMELPIAVSSEGGFAVISFGTNAGYAVDNATDDLPHELTLHFARQFLSNNGGRLEIDTATPPRGALRLYYPLKAE